MNNDQTLLFRAAVGIVIATWIAARIYFQQKMGNGEKVSALHSRREKISYMLVSFSFLPIFLYVFAGSFSFAHFTLPAWVRMIGVLVGLSGCALFAWIHLALGKNWSGVLEIAKGHELVTNGPYQFVRHPMYSAFFLMGAGVLLLSANWLVGGLNLVAVTYMYLMRVSDEEAMMIDQFGQSYQRYMSEAGRLFPMLWK
jgi:protein-S-isoprenylcysteine O-methyltransferase Ste14